MHLLPSAGINQDQVPNEIHPAWMNQRLIGNLGAMILKLWTVQMISTHQSITRAETQFLVQLQPLCQEYHQHPALALYQELLLVTQDSLISMTDLKRYPVT